MRMLPCRTRRYTFTLHGKVRCTFYARKSLFPAGHFGGEGTLTQLATQAYLFWDFPQTIADAEIAAVSSRRQLVSADKRPVFEPAGLPPAMTRIWSTCPASEGVRNDWLLACEIVLDLHCPLVAKAVKVPAVGVPQRTADALQEREEHGCRADSSQSRMTVSRQHVARLLEYQPELP